MADYALKTYVTTAVSTKQATLSTGLASTGSQSILSGTTIKTIVPGTGVSLSSDVNGIAVTGIDAYDKANIDSKISTINTNVGAKQATLSAGTATTGSQSILSGSIIKNIVPGTGISLLSDVNGVTVTGTDAYTKSEVNDKFSSLIGTAPEILNTLQEISASIDNYE